MHDLISRQSAIDEVKRLHDVAWTNWKETKISANTMIDALKDLPSAQPEIIHCRECKYWQDQEEGIVEVSICARPQNKLERLPMVMIINGDGYCSFAERRRDE